MTKLKIGVAGLGRGKEFVRIFDSLDSCRVTAVCDSNPEAVKAFQNKNVYTDYDEFIKEDLDIAAIITPGPLHAEQSVKAMRNGVHVLCETPNVYSADEASKVTAVFKETGRKYMLAENYLWNKWVQNVKEKCDAGMLGEAIYAEGDYTHDCRDLMLMDESGYVPYKERDKHPNAKKSWRATDLPPLSYCSHTLAPLLYLMDDRAVSAVGYSTGSRTAPDIGAIDLETALLETEKGAVIRLTNGFTVAHPFSTFYKLVGTKGSVQYGSAAGNTIMFYSDEDPAQEKEWKEIPSGQDNSDSTEQMIKEFVSAIQTDSPLPFDIYRSMDMILPGITAHESALAGGIKMSVPDLNM
jgi:predicted dehydrogenase